MSDLRVKVLQDRLASLDQPGIPAPRGQRGRPQPSLDLLALRGIREMSAHPVRERPDPLELPVRQGTRVQLGQQGRHLLSLGQPDIPVLPGMSGHLGRGPQAPPVLLAPRGTLVLPGLLVRRQR